MHVHFVIFTPLLGIIEIRLYIIFNGIFTFAMCVKSGIISKKIRFTILKNQGQVVYE